MVHRHGLNGFETNPILGEHLYKKDLIDGGRAAVVRTVNRLLKERGLTK